MFASLIWLVMVALVALQGCSGEPRYACGCVAVWRNPNCQPSELNPTGIEGDDFLVDCPNGLKPKEGKDVRIVKNIDPEFQQMAEQAVAKIKIWTGMVDLQQVFKIRGRWEHYDPTSGQNEFAHVTWCAVVELTAGKKPKDIKWGQLVNDTMRGGSTPEPPPPPPGPPGPPPVCDVVDVDNSTTPPTIVLTDGCVIVPTDVTSLMCGGTCDIASTDSACVQCAKDMCCDRVDACLRDPEKKCPAFLKCLQSSASCETNGDLAVDLNGCYQYWCNSPGYDCVDGAKGMCVTEGAKCNAATFPCCGPGVTCQLGTCLACTKSGDVCLAGSLCTSECCSGSYDPATATCD